MKNKEDEYICVCNSTGEFVDWLLDTIKNRMHTSAKAKDYKSLGVLNDLLKDVEAKLEEE
jgi:hypothetical protein